MPLRSLWLPALALLWSSAASAERPLFDDDFEAGLNGWRTTRWDAVSIRDSGDPRHGRILELQADGLVVALIRDSEGWDALRLEGEVRFPTDQDNYLGLVWGYRETSVRSDFTSLYIKGNDSYLRVNPWRDGNASRLLYEEFRTELAGNDAIRIGEWHSFKAEIVDGVCHFYVGAMDVPKLTVDLFEHESGAIGFKPRIVGGPVWLDNIRVTALDRLTYTGPAIPTVDYEPEQLLTDWQVLGPLPQPSAEIETGVATSAAGLDERRLQWRAFPADRRGAVVTGRVTEYRGARPVAYFRTLLDRAAAGVAELHFSTTDELALWVNHRFYGFVYRDGYVSGANDWNAWYDFYKNPEHAGRRVQVELQPGLNEILVRVRNGQFASGGYFAALED